MFIIRLESNDVKGKSKGNLTDGSAPTGPVKEIGRLADYGLVDNHGYGEGMNRQIQFDFSTVVPVGNELRPVNIAVRYFIEAA